MAMHTIRAFALALAVVLGCQPSDAQSLQFIEAWHGTTPLPSSTNQVTDASTCRAVNAANAQLAPVFEYVVDNLADDQSSVTYSSPETGYTVKQSCVAASPWMDALPRRPLSGAIPPPPPKIPCPAPTARALVLLTIGQSQAANNAESRYTAGPGAFMFSSGDCYQLTDPIIGADSNDGSVWGRLADLLLGTGYYDKVIVIGAAQSGSSVTQWAPGGSINANLLYQVKNAAAHGLPITSILWDQGVGDLGMTAATWHDQFIAMLTSVRPFTDAPIYVAKSATCHIRSGKMSQDQIDQLVWTGPDVYLSNEVRKDWLREGQRLVVDGHGVRAGPDLEIGPQYLFDGCHPSRIGAAMYARRWFDVLTARP